MNVKKSISLSILIFLTFALSAEKTGALLWKISGNGLKHSSYIFGTHHAFPVSFLDSVAGVKEAFASCRQMVGEIAMDDMTTLTAEIQKAGMMPPDSTWQMLLTADDYAFVDKQLTEFFGTGLQTLGSLKPFMVNMAYIVVFYQRMFPHSATNEAADMWFQQRAVERGIPIVGLETVHDQIAVFEVTSMKSQAADLVCLLKNSGDMERFTRKLNHLYRSADLTGISGLLREDDPCPSSAEQEAALNDTRNRRWLEKLPAIMSSKPSFIAVGCLHLIGEAGLLKGLEKAGYKIESGY